MSNLRDTTWLNELYPDKELSEIEAAEAKSNLFGFFSVLIEIDKQQKHD